MLYVIIGEIVLNLADFVTYHPKKINSLCNHVIYGRSSTDKDTRHGIDTRIFQKSGGCDMLTTR